MMSPTLFAGFLVFSIVNSITPGPNNLLMMASGSVFGLKRTLPHIAGVILGFGVMSLAVGFGLAKVLQTSPMLFVVLRWAAAAYILYIAWRMVTAKGPGVAVADDRPMSFLGAVAFQWVNPKAWVMALGAVGTFAEHDRFLVDVVVISITFMVVGVPCALTWTSFGSAIRRWFKKPGHLKAFNWTMAALLLASLYPLITEPLGPAR